MTIFPEFFTGMLRDGVVARGIRRGLASVETVDPRDFTADRHRTVDDRPFGGGAGMVFKPEPIAAAIESTGIAPKHHRDLSRESVVLLSPGGRPFTQAGAHAISKLKHVVLVCGRYEGVDERVSELFCDAEISIGDYVLSGGELGAAVIMDAAIRLLPGVLGNSESAFYDSFGDAETDARSREVNAPPQAASAAGGLLDYPHYTRPVSFRGLTVPDVLAGGDHAEIRRWRRQRAIEKTARIRPDLFQTAYLSSEERRTLADATGQGEPSEPNEDGLN